MNENSTSTELLIRYLDGELETEELQTIRQNLVGNPQLSAELESLRLTKESVKTYGLQKTIGNIHGEMMKELKEAPAAVHFSVRRIMQFGVRIAAILILVISVTFLYQYFSATPDNLFRNYYESFQLHTTRGANTTSVLEVPFQKGDAVAVMAAFKKIKNPGTTDYFLNGIAALRTDHAPDAIASFLSVQQNNSANNTHFFEDDADYYLALAYLRNNEPRKALPIFEHIHAEQNHSYHQKVSAWFLLKLKRLAAHAG